MTYRVFIYSYNWCRPPFATISPRRITPRRRKWLHTPTFSGTPGILHRSPQWQTHSPPFLFAPLRLGPAALLTAAPGRPIAAAEEDASPAAPHLDARMGRSSAIFTGSTATTPQAAANPVTGRETRFPPWAASCSRRPHLPTGFDFQTTISCRHRCRRLSVSSQVLCRLFWPQSNWR